MELVIDNKEYNIYLPMIIIQDNKLFVEYYD